MKKTNLQASSLVVIAMIFLFAGCQLVYSIQLNKEQNFYVLKNTKIQAISFTNAKLASSEASASCFSLKNTVQSITIETLVSKADSNCTDQLPIFMQKLNKKGYLKPVSNFNNKNKSEAIIGYKYLKPIHSIETDEISQQIRHFLQTLIKSQQLEWLGIRLQDTFQLYIIKEQKLRISKLQLRYLFSTIQKEQIPKQILSSIQLIQSSSFKLSSQPSGIIQRKLTGKGLHQWVNMTITLNEKLDVQIPQFKSCFAQFYDVLPETTYIDADQRREETSCIQTINVELPQFVSKQYFYRYKVQFSQFTQIGVHKYLYQQPVHFRYPIPSQNNFSKIYLHPIESAQIICSNNDAEKVSAQQKQTKIFALKQNNLFDRGTTKIPTGDSSHAKIVSVMTFVFTLLAAMMITKQLRKAD